MHYVSFVLKRHSEYNVYTVPKHESGKQHKMRCIWIRLAFMQQTSFEFLSLLFPLSSSSFWANVSQLSLKWPREFFKREKAGGTLGLIVSRTTGQYILNSARSGYDIQLEHWQHYRCTYGSFSTKPLCSTSTTSNNSIYMTEWTETRRLRLNLTMYMCI